MAKREIAHVQFDTEGRRLLLKALDAMTEKALAKAIGVAQQQISSWKLGKTRPKPEHRDALQNVAGIPSDTWYTRRERTVAKGRAGPNALQTGTDG